MSGDNKVKGLLKGLRFISQIFDSNSEKAPEIEIGHPTDVRHVAHIGWDGPTESSPSWMNEFKSIPGISSAPQNLNGDINGKGANNSSKVSADSTRRDSSSMNSQSQLPKTTRRHSNSKLNMIESQAKEKSDRPKQHRRPSKHSQNNDSFNGSMPSDTDLIQVQGSDLPPMGLPESPKKGRSKKTRDGSGGGGASKMRSKAHTRDLSSNEGSHSRSRSKSRNKNRVNEEDEQVERGCSAQDNDQAQQGNTTSIQTN